MQRVYKDNEWGKVSKRIITGSSSFLSSFGRPYSKGSSSFWVVLAALIVKELGLFNVMLATLMEKGLMQFLSMSAALLAKIAALFRIVGCLFSKGATSFLSGVSHPSD